MERRKFLGTLSSPVLTACLVCLGACTKNTNTNGSGAAANFTIDLNNSLTAIGSSIVQSGVIVVRLASGNTPASFTAVQVACTHEGTSINYNTASGQFICPLHGSTFTTTGAVTLGPATSSLKQYSIAVNGSTMTVTG